jgi:hypothetical protein
MAEISNVYITRGDGTEELVEADLMDGLTLDEVAAVDDLWDGPLLDLVTKFTAAGLWTDKLPPSWAWSWRTKMEIEASLEWCFLGITYNGTMQGMLVVDTFKEPCYHCNGGLGLYVCYIAAAPWNLGFYLNQIGERPVFDDIGTVLLGVAAQKSQECGCEGRLILHAIKESESFYLKRGMINTGSDNRHPQQLTRFELSNDLARVYLE